MRLLMMLLVAGLLIDIGFMGNLGSIIASIVAPNYMQETA